MNPGDLIEVRNSCYALKSVQPMFEYTSRILSPGTVGLVIEVVPVDKTFWMRILTEIGSVWCQVVNARRLQ